MSSLLQWNQDILDIKQANAADLKVSVDAEHAYIESKNASNVVKIEPTKVSSGILNKAAVFTEETKTFGEDVNAVSYAEVNLHKFNASDAELYRQSITADEVKFTVVENAVNKETVKISSIADTLGEVNYESSSVTLKNYNKTSHENDYTNVIKPDTFEMTQILNKKAADEYLYKTSYGSSGFKSQSPSGTMMEYSVAKTGDVLTPQIVINNVDVGDIPSETPMGRVTLDADNLKFEDAASTIYADIGVNRSTLTSYISLKAAGKDNVVINEFEKNTIELDTEGDAYVNRVPTSRAVITAIKEIAGNSIAPFEFIQDLSDLSQPKFIIRYNNEDSLQSFKDKTGTTGIQSQDYVLAYGQNPYFGSFVDGLPLPPFKSGTISGMETFMIDINEKITRDKLRKIYISNYDFSDQNKPFTGRITYPNDSLTIIFSNCKFNEYCFAHLFDATSAENKVTNLTVIFDSCEFPVSADATSMFAGLTNVDSLIIRGFNYSCVSNATSMFEGLGSVDPVETLELGTLNMAGITDVSKIENMFNNIKVSELNLRTLEFGEIEGTCSNFISPSQTTLVSINKSKLPGNEQSGTNQPLSILSAKNSKTLTLNTALTYGSIIDSGDVRIFNCVEQ